MKNTNMFATALKDLVADRGVTYEQLAKAVGLHKSTLSHYICGRCLPSVDIAVRIADFFECSVDCLLGLEDAECQRSFLPCPPFCERLPELLEYFHISRYRLQQLTGIAESAMRYWMQNKTSPTLESVVRIADALDCSVDFVLGR